MTAEDGAGEGGGRGGCATLRLVAWNSAVVA